MQIIITGSLGNISRRLTQQLVNQGNRLTVISHSPERATEIEALGATAAIGSLEDYAFLVRAFAGADAVYTMVPPNFHTTDYARSVQSVAENYAKALAENKVSQVVNLSSIGAHYPEGHGPSGAFYYEENELNQLPDTHILHLRAGMFYTNFYGNLEMIQQAHLIGNNFDGTVPLVLTHPHDIADVAAEALNKLSFTGKQIYYVVSDEKNGNQIAQILGNVIGKPDLPWVTFPDEALLQAMTQQGFSPHMAANFVELGIAIREGRLFSHYQHHKPAVLGERKFADFAREFATVYNNSLAHVKV